MVNLDLQPPIAHVTLDRPDVHNAFNNSLITLLTQTFDDLSARPEIRVIILRANGKSFCAGADLKWMRQMINYSREENIQDARVMAGMFLAIAKCSKPVIARVHGAALGGGSGLVASCDIAIALETAQFGFPEVKLGILPSVISPFVIARIGAGAAREYFLTGERFPASVALALGLVQHVVSSEAALDALINSKVRELLTSAPGAIAAAKEMIFGLAARTLESSIDFTAEAIATARAGAEGQSGVNAFLQREKPPWIPQ